MAANGMLTRMEVLVANSKCTIARLPYLPSNSVKRTAQLCSTTAPRVRVCKREREREYECLMMVAVGVKSRT